MEDKARVTVRFLKHKMAEHQALQSQIEQLRQEVQALEHGEHPKKLPAR